MQESLSPDPERPGTAVPRPHRGRRVPGASPLAIALTLACVAFAVLVGVTGPRLRARHGSAQQDLPLGELAQVAALHEARALLDMQRGRSREAALTLLADIARETVGRDRGADLEEAGFRPLDARIVEVAPGVKGAMVVYASAAPERIASVTMLPDDGRTVLIDGFGRAMPLAPGQEWIDAVIADDSTAAASNAGPRIAYAFADGTVLWVVLADDRATLASIARHLH